jgi:hypothetical protein
VGQQCMLRNELSLEHNENLIIEAVRAATRSLDDDSEIRSKALENVAVMLAGPRSLSFVGGGVQFNCYAI